MKSALSAILLNRMGDTFFVIALGLIMNYYKAVDFDTIILLTPYMNTLLLNILGILLTLAATAKSAQLGLHA
jgi:NADH-ubiquinone oxidoreductase chain 5